MEQTAYCGLRLGGGLAPFFKSVYGGGRSAILSEWRGAVLSQWRDLLPLKRVFVFALHRGCTAA